MLPSTRAPGGYCVFAQVEDEASFSVVDKVAAEVKAAGSVPIVSMRVV